MSISEREYRFLEADLAELDRMIATTPEASVIDLATLKYRRNQVQEELNACDVPHRWPVSARLTFKGKPVTAQHGIDAIFGAKAVNAFSNAVAIAGASIRGTLSSKGPIPNREDYKLLVTNTALGSFGFEIQEASGQDAPLIEGPSPVEMAIERVKAVLSASVADDETFAEAVAETQQREVDDLVRFLKLMADSQAVCSLSFKGDAFQFKDMGQVRQSIKRLSQDIKDEEIEIRGTFQGYLPHARRAEFRNQVTREVISGKVADSVSDAGEINELLGERVVINVRSRRAGSSRPRYTVIGFEAIGGTE